MSKLGKSSGSGGGGVILNDIKPLQVSTMTTRVTRASTALAAKQQQLQAQTRSIVSIEVNMIESSSSNAPPPVVMKKKRSALGNISNAVCVDQSATSTNASAANGAVAGGATGSVAKEQTKKYRFGGANIANVIPSFGGQKKVDITGAHLAKKISSKFIRLIAKTESSFVSNLIECH